jgi:hypothetical protein
LVRPNIVKYKVTTASHVVKTKKSSYMLVSQPSLTNCFKKEEEAYPICHSVDFQKDLELDDFDKDKSISCGKSLFSKGYDPKFLECPLANAPKVALAYTAHCTLQEERSDDIVDNNMAAIIVPPSQLVSNSYVTMYQRWEPSRLKYLISQSKIILPVKSKKLERILQSLFCHNLTRIMLKTSLTLKFLPKPKTL